MTTIAPAPDDDDDDWIDIERPSAPGAKRADVTARLSKNHADRPARAFLAFRGDAAAWFAGGTRWRAQIGGQLANRVRFVVDNERGCFEAANMRGARVVRLGIVTAWPNEARDLTDCTWTIAARCMVITLPEDWAKPRLPPAPKPPAPKPPAAAPVPERTKPASFPISTGASGLASIAAERDELAEKLRQREDEERERDADIPAVIAGVRVPPLERKTLALLMRRENVTKVAILAATARPGADGDDRDEKLADVIVCKLRPKLEPLGVEIKTIWGEGYSISAVHRRLLRNLFARKPVAVAALGDPPAERSALAQRGREARR